MKGLKYKKTLSRYTNCNSVHLKDIYVQLIWLILLNFMVLLFPDVEVALFSSGL